jgi:hypothetical protein
MTKSARPLVLAGGAALLALLDVTVVNLAALDGLGLTLRTAPAATKDDAPKPEATSLPWRRFVVVGDSLAEGIGDPAPGYEHLGWADRVASTLGADYLNLGRRNLLAAEVRATQLEPALAFGPDLAAVVCGGNDLMRPDHNPEAVERDVDAIVAALRAAGSEVIMLAPFDLSQSELLPDQKKPAWRSLIEQYLQPIPHQKARCRQANRLTEIAASRRTQPRRPSGRRHDSPLATFLSVRWRAPPSEGLQHDVGSTGATVRVWLEI